MIAKREGTRKVRTIYNAGARGASARALYYQTDAGLVLNNDSNAEVRGMSCIDFSTNPQFKSLLLYLCTVMRCLDEFRVSFSTILSTYCTTFLDTMILGISNDHGIRRRIWSKDKQTRAERNLSKNVRLQIEYDAITSQKRWTIKQLPTTEVGPVLDTFANEIYAWDVADHEPK